MDNFWATFFGVLLSFTLSVLSYAFFRSQKNKTALVKLVRELNSEIELNIVALYAFNTVTQDAINKQRLTVKGPRLSLIVYENMVASGEFRLITDPDIQTAIRHTAFFTKDFNEFASNIELYLAITNLKEQTLALPSAIERLTTLMELAKDTITKLQSLQNIMKTIVLPQNHNLKLFKLNLEIWT